MGCRTQALTCLRSVPVRRLLAAQDQESEPIIDGRVLTRSISTALARGQFQRVPLMNGTTADEWRLMVALSHDLVGRPVTARTYRSAIAAAFGVRPAVAAEIATRYPLNAYPSPALALAAAGTDGIFACTAREVNQLASRYSRSRPLVDATKSLTARERWVGWPSTTRNTGRSESCSSRLQKSMKVA
ncbi:MAG TPA: hypothetical protein VKP64_16235, partial [Mycobacteriales bacterium]|nr:hypothetical protein [Mycobacteriales bacterium]